MNTRPSDADNVARFIMEAVTLDHDPDAMTFCDELYEGYVRWVRARKAGPLLPRRTLISKVRDLTAQHCRYGVQRRAGTTRRGFRGMSLRVGS